MTRRRPLAAAGLSVGVALALAAGSGCSIIKTDDASRATTTKKGTPGTLPTTTLPPEAFGPTTLEGTAVKLTEVAKVQEPTVITSRSGSPTMFIGDDMYFGNDRLPLIREALQRKKASAA